MMDWWNSEGGDVVFSGRHEIKNFGTVFRDFGKKYGNGIWETVFSTLDGAGNYWKKLREIGIGNEKKRYLDIWTSSKKYCFLFFTFAGILYTLKTLKISKFYIK